MKKLTMIVVILFVALTATSCSVWKQERLYKIARLTKATNMLKATQPQYADSLGRKRGIVSNMDRYRPIKIVIYNETTKERKSYFLAPGQWLMSYLADGECTATAYYENREAGHWEFEVNPLNVHNYMGNEVHWYLVYSNGY